MTGKALLLLDMMHTVCAVDGEFGVESGLSARVEKRSILGKVQQTLKAARHAGIPIAHTRLRFDDEYSARTNRSALFDSFETAKLFHETSPGIDFVAEAYPHPGEIVIFKGGVCPFTGTNLGQRLTSLGVSELYLGGIATNFCVESAARTAGDSGYKVTVLEDLCETYDDEMQAFAVERIFPTFAEVSSSDKFLGVLNSL